MAAKKTTTPPADDQPMLWDTEGLAVILRVPAKTLRAWRCRGLGPAYHKYGKRVTYLAEDVNAWLATTRIVPTEF